ncbi:hypothetical protein BDB01DRAFT_786805 [Pilobolus umbonatus]|nr:hypothetical protein BDB01DRAFT_786805 [Pilobolus umbonatus]
MSINDCASSPYLNSIPGINAADIFVSPDSHYKRDTWDHKHELEQQFCRDYMCCGMILSNLHKLLDHYEDHHLNRTDQQENPFSPLSHFFNYDTPPRSQTLTSMPTKKKRRPYSLQVSITNLSLIENARKYPSKSVETVNTLLGARANCSEFGDNNNLNDSILNKHPTINPPINTAWNHTSHQPPPIRKQNNTLSEDDKPYRCHVNSCGKAYKNANGLKYHRLHGNCDISKVESLIENRRYTCSFGLCHKKYKNLNGLKYHIRHVHMGYEHALQ